MLKIDGLHIKDEHGRAVLLRGVNLGGSTKVPVSPNGATHLKEHFYDYKTASFVGRPFPAGEADEHFSRLRHWGFNCLRFLVTWEAIEPAGPGQYDQAYLDYVQKMVAKAGEYGFYVFIDPHQDVWSRWTGGDGAPAWTLEAVGFNLQNLHATGSAFVHQEHGDPLPMMTWATNYNKLAAATMFTLFFAGHDLAPNTLINGLSAQQFLQTHYINAIKQVAERVKHMPHVLGYDVLNEPSAGWICWQDLYDYKSLFNRGPSPTPFQSMLLGAGFSQEVAVQELGLTGEKTTGYQVLNPGKLRAWQEGVLDVWQANGVWEIQQDEDDEQYRGVLLRPHHFSQFHGRPIDFNQDYYAPFIVRYAQEIRAIHPQAIIFVESAFTHPLPTLNIPNVVNANHWYDALTLLLKKFYSQVAVDSHTQAMVFGSGNTHRSFTKQLRHIKEEGQNILNAPTLIGEFGIPYDLDDRVGYTLSDFSAHQQALDRYWQALEANVLHGTLWNYTADNSNERGDLWNGEDLSIFSRDQHSSLRDPHNLDDGGRAVGAFCRPFPRHTAGEIQTLSFNLQTREFTLEFTHFPGVTAPTEIYVPEYHYGVGLGVEFSDGRCEHDPEQQLLRYYHDPGRPTHTVRIFRDKEEPEINDKKVVVQGLEYPLEHHFVRTNGLTLHTVQAGPQNGELVVLLHGFPDFWYSWRHQIPFLVRLGYRVVAIDQRGYNLSEKPGRVEDYRLDKLTSDVVGVLDALGREQAYLVGHDWGAMVSWALAAKYPSRFKKVVAMNVPHPHIFTDHLWSSPRQVLKSWYALSFQIPAVPEFLGRLGNCKPLELALTQSGLPDTFTQAELQKYREAWLRPKAISSMLNWYRAAFQHEIKLPDPYIKLPFLLIWGAQDVALGREMVRPSVEKYCPQGHYHLIEEASHWVHHDEPGKVNDLIGRFFGR